MAEVNWNEHTDDEVIRAWKTAPRIFGPWTPWDRKYGGEGYAWSRREVFPGPSYKSGGSISVQRNTPNYPGYGVCWWDGEKERHENSFATPEEAMTRGDEWLSEFGHRLQATDQSGVATEE